MAQTVNLSGELDTVRKKLELAEMDNSNLRTENKELTTRIIEEKDKTASQMNAMNEIFDGIYTHYSSHAHIIGSTYLQDIQLYHT